MTQMVRKQATKMIWKYPLSMLQDEFRLEMPKNAVVRHVATQGEQPCMWVEVEEKRAHDKSTYETRQFRIAGTGHVMEDTSLYAEESPYWVSLKEHEYIGTFMLFQGSLVFHLFEIYAEPVPENVEVVDSLETDDGAPRGSDYEPGGC